VAQVEDLAGPDEVVESGHRLLDGRLPVGEVDLVEVDTVGAEPSEGGLDGLPDVAAGSPGAAVGAEVAVQVAAELGGDDGLVAAAAEGGAEHLFRVAGLLAVDVGRIEEVDTQVKGGVDDILRASVVDAAAEVVAADADRGDDEAGGAETAVSDVGHGHDPMPDVTLER
jgi:hypothetical protein